MKRLFLLVFVSVMMSSTCFAMTFEYLGLMSIGGVQINNSEEYVKSIYGEPNRIEYVKDRYGNNIDGSNKYGSTVYRYVYGDTFNILFCGYNGVPMTVCEISSVANNGIRTEAGLSVGDTESTITNLYGTENLRINHEKNGVIGYGFGARSERRFNAYVRHGEVIKIELISVWNVPGL